MLSNKESILNQTRNIHFAYYFVLFGFVNVILDSQAMDVGLSNQRGMLAKRVLKP